MPATSPFPLIRIVAVACLVTCGVVSNLQAAPEIRTVSVRGLQIDGTTTVRVDGTGLLPNPQLVLSVPIAKQLVKTGATATRVELDVTLAGDIDPGIYNLWLACDDGVSAPAVIAVDGLPQVPFAAEAESLPVAMHGVISGSNRMRTSFAAKAGETVLIEVEAQRLGGKLRPVLHIFDAENQQLGWTLPSPSLRGDARLSFTAPSDGTYTIELHDLQYAAPAPNHFRLKIGSWQYADQVFPPAVQAGTESSVSLIGGQTETAVPFRSPATPASDLVSAPWSDRGTSAGFRPSLLVSPIPEFVEARTEAQPQSFATIPAAMSGRLIEAGEIDRYVVPVTAGAKLRFEIFADRIGSPIDAVLELQNDKGGRLSLNDDAAGSPDSRIDYTIPANVTSVVVAVKDANGRGGSDCIYRVAVTSLDTAESRPDFRLSLAQPRHSVAAGNRTVIKVEATRTNYDGPIELKFETPLDGVALQDTTIPAGANATLITVSGGTAGLSRVLTSLQGTARIGDAVVQRRAVAANHVLAKLQPWLGEEIGMAVTPASATGFQSDWGNAEAELRLALGSKLDVPVSVVRPPGFDGPVRLTLETGQKPVRASNNQVDNNRTLRSETNKPLELAADANAQKAWDAKLAADKVLTDAKTAQAKTAEAGEKATAPLAAALKTATADLTAARTRAEKPLATVKAAAESDEQAQKALAAATAASQATADAVTKAADSDPQKLTAAAKAAADAAAAAKVAANRKAETGNALVVATTAAKPLTDAVAAAQKVVSDAEAKLKVAMAAAAKADESATAQVKNAETKLATAIQAAEAASAAAKNDGVFSIFVPADLKGTQYQFALRSELLSRDKKTVIDLTYTPVRVIQTMNPLVVNVVVSEKLTGVIDPKAGATITISGQLERLVEIKQDVTVSVAGLPKGIAVPKVVVKPDQNEFKLEAKFPATFKPAEIEGVKVFATAKVRPNAPIDVRSVEVPVTISLTAAEVSPAG